MAASPFWQPSRRMATTFSTSSEKTVWPACGCAMFPPIATPKSSRPQTCTIWACDFRPTATIFTSSAVNRGIRKRKHGQFFFVLARVLLAFAMQPQTYHPEKDQKHQTSPDRSRSEEAHVSTDSGQVLKRLDFERPRVGLVRFNQDGKAVVYPTRDKGIDNLWLRPLDGSKGKQLTDFTPERIWDFHWSFDGSKLALVRGHTDADVVLIRDAQQ